VCSDSEPESVVVPHRRKKRALSDDSDEEEEESSHSGVITPELLTPVTKRVKKIEKTEDDAIPLPDPFPLPKHYRSDVEVALKSKKMTTETRSCFILAVASAMLRYKRYPSRDDYVCVARAVLSQYPFLKSPTGTPHVRELRTMVLCGPLCMCVLGCCPPNPSSIYSRSLFFDADPSTSSCIS